MGKIIYGTLAPLIRLFTPKMETVWDVPYDGEPCIFVGNHDRANGPISVAVKFPLKDRCHIWIYANAMERKLVPAYVRQDYWWNPESRLAPLYDRTIPYLTALALPPILKSVPNVPVYHDMRAMTTLRESLRLLEAGKSLIIFPGIPDGYKSHSDTRTSEGSTNPRVAAAAPAGPLTCIPTKVAALMPMGPGVISAMVARSRNCSAVSHPCISTAWLWIRGMAAYPPPTENKQICRKLVKSSSRIMPPPLLSCPSGPESPLPPRRTG